MRASSLYVWPSRPSTPQTKKRAGAPQNPGVNGPTKRLKRSVLLLLRGFLLGSGLLRGLLLGSHHSITSFSFRYGPEVPLVGGIHAVVRRERGSLLPAPPLQPHGFRRGPSWMRTPRRWRMIEMVRFLVSGPLPLWWQPRAASPYDVSDTRSAPLTSMPSWKFFFHSAREIAFISCR